MPKTNRTKKRTKKNTYAVLGDLSQDPKTVKSIKAKSDEERSFTEVVADRTTAFLGSTIFLLANILIIIVWIIINMGLVPGIQPFDAFPFALLTTAVSLEAIILAILVLISQNRAARVADLREEVQLQVNILTEEEITRLLWMLILLFQKNGIPIPEDKRLQKLLRATDIKGIEKRIEKQIDKS